MAQFDFKLHAVLRQRELIEQQCQRELALALSKKAAEQAELKRLDETVRMAVADLRQNRLVGEVDLSFLAAHRRFMSAMQRQGAVQLAKLEEATKQTEAARLRLAEASKQKKIIEKLREKQMDAWARALARKEANAMDEIAMQMNARSMIEHAAADQTSAQWTPAEETPTDETRGR